MAQTTKEKLKAKDKALAAANQKMDRAKEEVKKLNKERKELMAVYTEELLERRDFDIYDLEDVLDLSIQEAVQKNTSEGNGEQF
ncbi:hypothetical protein [Lactococcus petauri]|uniref:Uncharacterized protein n=1 Tax=Lactococcus petauri TaxID=1940789 RepID=A0AAJ2MKY4_9LACT|nr:hypothetical protein [Lactococcus petauri]MDT2527155.1 hypothetical protein [Lactococcus petauri]MDT2541730.1 hypothetical protein [Lactococcus petauri]MDT2560438.1 hypothetical protein [Lactococcus petauri]MDT2568980.1 hypothetical protein [Lactococcus petauri]MDT2587942.1 hypothetical protein [Lactococcus petauri]